MFQPLSHCGKVRRCKYKMAHKKYWLKKLIVVGILAVVLTTLLVLKNNVAVSEFMATTFARGWIWLFGNILGWIPISFYELFLIVAILALLLVIILMIANLCKRNFRRVVSTLLTTVIVVLSGVTLYTAVASFSYNREPLPEEILTEYSSNDFTYEEALLLAKYVINKANECYQLTEHDSNGNVVLPSFDQLNDMIIEEYKRLDCDYFSSFTPRAKRIINKRIMSEMHITGVFFAPFGEANVNGNENNLFTPGTIAHEMAHGKGVMRESDANMVKSYLLLTSQNPYLQYSGWVDCLSKAISMVSYYPEWTQDLRAELRNSVNPAIWKEISNYNNFYGQFTLFNDVGNFFNDIYLKLQGETDGVDSYVKPPVIQGTGQFTPDGEEIVVVRNFSDVQNLLITLYKQGKIVLQ